MLTQRFVGLAATLLMAASVSAQETGAADPRYTWDLTELYATPEAWAEAREAVLADLDDLDALRGTLGDSADSLYAALSTISAVSKEASRVATYASLNADEDLRVTATQERRELSRIMSARAASATAWLQPEILEIG
ncbi:MAG: oligoendopeptidase F, partial [Pseudomonadota bacterium]